MRPATKPVMPPQYDAHVYAWMESTYERDMEEFYGVCAVGQEEECVAAFEEWWAKATLTERDNFPF